MTGTNSYLKKTVDSESKEKEVEFYPGKYDLVLYTVFMEFIAGSNLPALIMYATAEAKSEAADNLEYTITPRTRQTIAISAAQTPFVVYTITNSLSFAFGYALINWLMYKAAKQICAKGLEKHLNSQEPINNSGKDENLETKLLDETNK